MSYKDLAQIVSLCLVSWNVGFGVDALVWEKYGQFDNWDIWMARQMTTQTTLPLVVLMISIWWPRAMGKLLSHLNTLGNLSRLILHGPYWKELLHQGSKPVRHAGSQQGVIKLTKLDFVESVPIARTSTVLLEERISFVSFVGKDQSPFFFFQVSCTDIYSRQHRLCYVWSFWWDCLLWQWRHQMKMRMLSSWVWLRN